MTFQAYIYILEQDYGCGKMTYSYPNFKKAYEQMEKWEDGNTIIDCGQNGSVSSFEAIRFSEYSNIFTHKYTITRNLLTIFPEDKIVTPSMICKIEKENEKAVSSKYKLRAEVI